MRTYISFCGYFIVPENAGELDTEYPEIFQEIFEGTDSFGEERYSEKGIGFRENLSYLPIDGQDSLTVYLADIDGKIGHLVADCPEGNWVEETFVYLDRQGNPVKAPENFNPNPVRQLVG